MTDDFSRCRVTDRLEASGVARKVTLAITKPSDTRPSGTRIQPPRQSGFIRSRSFAYSYGRGRHGQIETFRNAKGTPVPTGRHKRSSRRLAADGAGRSWRRGRADGGGPVYVAEPAGPAG